MAIGQASKVRRVRLRSPRALARTLLFGGLILLLLGAGAPSRDFDAGDRVAALLLQGMLHEAAGEYKAALSFYQSAAEIDTEGAARGEALALAGIASFKAGALPEAKQLLIAAGEALPTSALVQFYLGRLFEVEGSPREARERYLKAAELSPLWPDPIVRAGALMNGDGEYLASFSLLHRAMPIAGRLSDYYEELSEAYLGLRSSLHGNPMDPSVEEALKSAGIEETASHEALLEELLRRAEHAQERARQLASDEKALQSRR